MYTDYHAETYFLQIPDDNGMSNKSADAFFMPPVPDHRESACQDSGAFRSPGMGETADDLTPTPAIPAKHDGEEQ
jgi:hypothetical protein